MRAPPHGFSQLATSFLACPRLGIPRAPLLRLTGSFFSLPEPAHLAHRLTALVSSLTRIVNQLRGAPGAERDKIATRTVIVNVATMLVRALMSFAFAMETNDLH